MPIRLHINVDHVATLRNARGSQYPDPVLIAELCELAGADGITVHLREDRRHIQDRDLERMRAQLGTVLNLECAPTEEMLHIIERVRPDVVTLVPEKREERTTEGGLDVVAGRERIERAARVCQSNQVKLSLFIEAQKEQIALSRELGANQVEFHTGDYCLAKESRAHEILQTLRAGAHQASSLGLEVAAGHGLTRHNVRAIAEIPEVEELNIGHAVISDALFVGIDAAVKGFRAAIERGVRKRSERGSGA
ncbi:MAG: pyridoxine 5'-phosphate synthase [Polyangiaceae bacterium]|nr:pyridoxine 5'-phosphate synthase [Polyangiaceae bacterium]